VVSGVRVQLELVFESRARYITRIECGLDKDVIKAKAIEKLGEALAVVEEDGSYLILWVDFKEGQTPPPTITVDGVEFELWDVDAYLDLDLEKLAKAIAEKLGKKDWGLDDYEIEDEGGCLTGYIHVA